MAGAFSCIFLFCLCAWQLAGSTTPPATIVAPDFVVGRILIRPKAGLASTALENFQAGQKSRIVRTFKTFGAIQVLQVPEGDTVQSLIAKYQRSGLVDFAEPDYILRASATLPNDPIFLDGFLWGLDNYGQNGGTPGADIRATSGWDVQTCASNVVVAILDTGIRCTHEDLAANMWLNTNDNSHGYDAFTDTNDPSDDQGHGTLIAGVVGAVGNNGKGVTGVAWQVRMMACKCLDLHGQGSDSTLIACLEFAQTNGARIINASLDSASYSEAVSNTIASLRDAGIILVASAGNNWADVDVTPRFPACYDLDNIVSVAYTARDDTLGFLSNYGPTNVDLAAPGGPIYSTSNQADDSYYPTNFPDNMLVGTSFAAAYVSGALALMQAKYPLEDYRQNIFRLLHTTDPVPDLEGKCVTGGRLNLRKALCPPITLLPVSTNCKPFQFQIASGPYRTCAIESSADLTSWSPIFTNTTSTNWTFDFTDDQSTNSPQTFYRAVLRH
jgi:subtilisin family serine protease